MCFKRCVCEPAITGASQDGVAYQSRHFSIKGSHASRKLPLGGQKVFLYKFCMAASEPCLPTIILSSERRQTQASCHEAGMSRLMARMSGIPDPSPANWMVTYRYLICCKPMRRLPFTALTSATAAAEADWPTAVLLHHGGGVDARP